VGEPLASHVMGVKRKIVSTLGVSGACADTHQSIEPDAVEEALVLTRLAPDPAAVVGRLEWPFARPNGRRMPAPRLASSRVKWGATGVRTDQH